MLRVIAITASVAMAASVALVGLGMLTSRPAGTFCVEEPQTFPALGINGWRGDQLENAAVIIHTAESMGFDRDGQIIGVMAAMGESSLRNIEHGDWETSRVTNPDGTRTTSIGLFQQQDWWGTAEERMEPATATAKFYSRLARIHDWQQLAPSHAINRVQINSDREHYARFEYDATAVVDTLGGACDDS